MVINNFYYKTKSQKSTELYVNKFNNKNLQSSQPFQKN